MPQERRSQQKTGEDLADHPGLAQAAEQRMQAARRPNHQEELHQGQEQQLLALIDRTHGPSRAGARNAARRDRILAPAPQGGKPGAGRERTTAPSWDGGSIRSAAGYFGGIWPLTPFSCWLSTRSSPLVMWPPFWLAMSR